MKKKSLSTVLLALVAAAALVFVVPAGAEHVDSHSAGGSVAISIKPWAYGFYGRAPVTNVTDKTCATADRDVAVYEITGDHPDPDVDHKVAESERDGPPRDWSMRGVDPGRRYYAEVAALTKPRCGGGRSEVVTAPPAPKPDEQAPRCVRGIDVECFYDFHGTLDTSTRTGCDEGLPKEGSGYAGYACIGEYRRPDGTMGKFRADVYKEDGHAMLITVRATDGADWVEINGEAHAVDGNDYALEAYCSGSYPGCPTSIFPARGEPGSRGGFLALSQVGNQLEIRGYAHG